MLSELVLVALIALIVVCVYLLMSPYDVEAEIPPVSGERDGDRVCQRCFGLEMPDLVRGAVERRNVDAVRRNFRREFFEQLERRGGTD